MDAWSWCSLLGTGSTLDFNFYIFGFFSAMYSKSVGANTLGSFFKILCWSLQALWEGRWPSTDHHGRPFAPGTQGAMRANTYLADGHFGILVAVKGDLDYYGKVLKLPFYSSSKPCALCACNTSTVPWSDFSAGAAWRAACWDNSQWRAAHPQGHQLFHAPFACGISGLCADVMHIKHMGTDAWFFGSVLHLLCFSVLPGTPAENMSTVWAFLDRDMKDTDWPLA